MSGDRTAGTVAWLLALLLVLFLGLPIVALVARSVAGGNPGAEAWQTPLIDALSLSLVTTALSLALTVVLGTPLAWLLAHGRMPAAALVEPIIDLPIVLPPAVAGLALLLLFGRNGPLGAPLASAGLELPFTTAAVVMAQTFVSAPFYVRAARAGFGAVPAEMEDAARIDGAGELAVARHVSAPLAIGGLSAGAITAWARALGEFGATIMFAGSVMGRTQTLPLLVYSQFQSGLAAALPAAVILIGVALAVLLAVRLVGRRNVAELRSLG
jgi:molybdate transport system permease protein